MKLSTRTKYGLKLCFLLGISSGEPLSVLAERTGHSKKYLEQLLIKLKKSGILEAERGVNGGYRLARPAKDITINEILIALDDGFDIRECAETCTDAYCPNKRIFQVLNDNINSTLGGISLQDMIDDYRCVKQ